MSEHSNKPAVDAWLENGGAEIVLEVIRRKGWTVEIPTGDDPPYTGEVVLTADFKDKTISLIGAKRPCLQSIFAMAVVRGEYSGYELCGWDENGRSLWRRLDFRILCEDDETAKRSRWSCYHDIALIRAASEAAIACMARKESE